MIFNAIGKDGKPIKAGDIVTVTTKYRVVKVYEDGHVLAQKIYDVPASAMTKIDEEV